MHWPVPWWGDKRLLIKPNSYDDLTFRESIWMNRFFWMPHRPQPYQGPWRWGDIAIDKIEQGWEEVGKW